MFRFLIVGITVLGVAMQSRAISTAPVAKSFAFRVLLSLNTKAGRGELRPLGEEHNLRVLSVFMGLGVARQR
jgi:hypothetical protein